MKSVLISFIVLFILPVNANAVEGVWAFSGVGCRDERTLSADSHRTKATFLNTAGLSEATLYLEANNKAEIIVVLNGEEETMRAEYFLTGNEVIFNHEAGRDSMFLVDNRLIIISEDEEEIRNCRSGEAFVFVLGKV